MMPVNSPSWPRRLLRALPFLIPPSTLLLIVWLQPEGHLGARPDRAPWVGKLVYDDWDWSAAVLRGLNASMGRKAGLAEPPHPSEEEFCAALDDPDRPLSDRYYLEYPQAATWFFVLPYLVRPIHAPAAVCDGHYGNLLFHEPRNDPERDLWRDFRHNMQIYTGFMAVCLMLFMLVVHAGYEPGGGLGGPVWLLVLPGTLFFALNRYDVLPALLTAVSLACLGRRWLTASAVFLAAATVLKVYPVLLAPLVFRYLWADRRAALTWAAAYGVAAAAMFVPPLFTADWEAVAGPYRVQLEREPLGPTFYDRVIPKALAENDAQGRGFRFGALALVMAALCLPRLPDLASLLRRGAVAVIVFASLAVFYSPQWIVWFSPFLVPLAGRRWSVLVLVAALDVVTYLWFQIAIDAGYRTWPVLAEYLETLDGAWSDVCESLVWARIYLLGALVVVLLWDEVRPAITKATARVFKQRGPAIVTH